MFMNSAWDCSLMKSLNWSKPSVDLYRVLTGSSLKQKEQYFLPFRTEDQEARESMQIN